MSFHCGTGMTGAHGCRKLDVAEPVRRQTIFNHLKPVFSMFHSCPLWLLWYLHLYYFLFKTDSLFSFTHVTFYHLFPKKMAKCEKSFSPCKPLKAVFQTIKVNLSAHSSHKSDLNHFTLWLTEKVGLNRSRELISLLPQLSPWTQLFARCSKALLMMSSSSWSQASDFNSLLRNLCTFTWILRYG